MNARERYEAGELAEAIRAVQQQIKAHPTDTSQRGFLCELLCFSGEFERADKQLETIAKQDPDLMLGIVQFRQVLRAEMARQQCFREGRAPELLGEPSLAVRKQLEALVALREGDGKQAGELLDEAEAARTPTSGSCDGRAFDDWRDLDDVIAGMIEVHTTAGKYYWIPAGQFASIEFHKPERPRDLIWRRAHIDVVDGPDAEVFLPAIYPQTDSSDDAQLMLGRGSAWTGGEGLPVRGQGQRMFLAGDDSQAIMSLRRVEFTPVADNESPAPK